MYIYIYVWLYIYIIKQISLSLIYMIHIIHKYIIYVIFSCISTTSAVTRAVRARFLKSQNLNQLLAHKCMTTVRNGTRKKTSPGHF